MAIKTYYASGCQEIMHALANTIISKIKRQLDRQGKGVYWVFSDFFVLGAIATKRATPFSIEAITALPPKDFPKLKDHIIQFSSSRNQYIRSQCAVYPNGRFMSRARIDAKGRRADPSFLAEFAQERCHIDVEMHKIAVVLPNSGKEYDPETDSLGKDFLFCGGPTESFNQWQSLLLSCNVYPETLALGTLAAVGALSHYLKFRNLEAPVLWVELAFDKIQACVVKHTGVEMTYPISHGLEAMLPILVNELKLNDISVAREALLSGTLSLSGIESLFLEKLSKDLKACLGFYEMQAGIAIENIFFNLMPGHMRWISDYLCRSLELNELSLDYVDWLKALNIGFSSNVSLDLLEEGTSAFSLFSLMCKQTLNSEISHV